MSSPQPPINPYEPPAPMPAVAYVPGGTAEVRDKLKKFRDQIHALGAFWIFLAVLAIGIAAYLINSWDTDQVGQVAAVIMVVVGCGWLGLGVATCLKQMWAVYVGLVLSYLSLVGNIVRLNLCGLIIIGAVILQAHRVISWAKELRSLGIPLTARPGDLDVPT